MKKIFNKFSGRLKEIFYCRHAANSLIFVLVLPFFLFFSEAGNLSAQTEISGKARTKIIKFGSLPAIPNSDKRFPLEWIVLETAADGSMLLLSKECIDYRQYHYRFSEIDWKHSDLRSWLNGTFYNMMFSSKDKKRIRKTEIVNGLNDKYMTEGGEDTDDNVFLLSIAEYKKYRRIIPENTYNSTYSSMRKSHSLVRQNADWWLRSPGKNPNFAAYVSGSSGELRASGTETVNFKYARPVIWLLPPVKSGRSRGGNAANGGNSLIKPFALIPAAKGTADGNVSAIDEPSGYEAYVSTASTNYFIHQGTAAVLSPNSVQNPSASAGTAAGGPEE